MSSESPRRPGELAFNAALLIFSLWLLWQAFSISGFSGLSTPGVFPMLASGVMVISLLAVLGKVVKRPAAHGGARTFLQKVTPRRHVVMLGLVLAYVAFMPLLGFLLASGLFLFASIAFLWRRSLLVTAGISLLALGLIYLVFRVAFQVVLPRGELMQWVF